MTRRTSAEAYHEIKVNGLLTRMRFVVYDALFREGPMTAQETWHFLRDEAARSGNARINGITPRFSELERQGVIEGYMERPCKITGRNCIVWRITENLPKKLEKQPAKQAKLADKRSQDLENYIFDVLCWLTSFNEVNQTNYGTEIIRRGKRLVGLSDDYDLFGSGSTFGRIDSGAGVGEGVVRRGSDGNDEVHGS